MRGDRGARLVGPTGIGVAGGADDREAQRLEDGAETPPSPSDREPIGVAVVRVAQRQELGAALDAAVDPVLECDLQGLLHGDRTVGGEEEVGIVHRHHGGQGLGQLDDHACCRCPSIVECATLAAWAARAASSSGTRWPRVFTQSEEMASR